jgi:hypothetical protein
VGAKLLLQGFGVHVPIFASLLVILVAIAVSIVTSLAATRGEKTGGGGDEPGGRENDKTHRTREDRADGAEARLIGSSKR